MKRYFALQGIRNRDIADAMGVSASNVSNMLNGRDSLGRARAQQLHDMFGFNIHFLLTGEGDLLAPDSGAAVVQQNGGHHNEQTVTVSATGDAATLRAQLEASKAQIQALKEENFRLWQMVEKMTSQK